MIDCTLFDAGTYLNMSPNEWRVDSCLDFVQQSSFSSRRTPLKPRKWKESRTNLENELNFVITFSPITRCVDSNFVWWFRCSYAIIPCRTVHRGMHRVANKSKWLEQRQACGNVRVRRDIFGRNEGMSYPPEVIIDRMCPFCAKFWDSTN